MVIIDANRDIDAQFRLAGQVSAHWSKDNTRNSFIRVDSDHRNTMQEAEGSVCSFSLKCSMCERPPPTMVARLLMNLGPVNHKESLVDIFFLKVHNLEDVEKGPPQKFYDTHKVMDTPLFKLANGHSVLCSC